jgi:succinyl-diaminopimelate desuccinylase
MGELQVALDYVERHGDELIGELDALLRFDTSMPPGRNYPAIVEHLEGRLGPLGFSFERVEVPEKLWRSEHHPLCGSRTNLIATRPRGLPELSVYAHLDTVPPGDNWDFDPFTATVDGDHVYGRGASDMKGGIASLIVALRAAHAAQLALRFDPVLLLCTDEEGGTYPGIRYLAEQGYIAGHLLCLDGHAEPRLWAGCCGLIDFRIMVKGRAGHSGATEGTINAIEEAVPILVALGNLKDAVEGRRSGMPAPPGSSSPYVGARLNLTMARGGVKTTSIPDTFDLHVNRRYLPEESFSKVVSELESTARRAAEGGRCEVLTAVTAHLPPVRNPIGPNWSRWQACLAAGFGYAPEEFVLYGASSSSDMGWVQATGTQEILLGGVARSSNNIHGPNERVALRDLQGLARALLKYLSAEPADGQLRA